MIRGRMMEFFKISTPKSTTYVLRFLHGGTQIIKIEGGEGYYFQLKAPVGMVRVNYNTQEGLSQGLKGLSELMSECGSITEAIILLNEVGAKNDKM